MKIKRYKPSVGITVRYHDDELKVIDKKRKKTERSKYIREKSLK